QRREVMLTLCVVEDIATGGVPEALVQVTAVTVLVGERLGHEARCQPLQQTKLLDAVAEEQRAVGGLHSGGVTQVHLGHALAVLAVVALDGYAVRVHHAAQPPDDELVAGGTVQAVTACGRAEGSEVAPAFLPERPLVLAPNAELQFDGQLGSV